MFSPKFFLIFLFVFSLFSTPSFSIEKSYLVTKVIDGDTFDATDGVIEFRVRLAGIDAPEKDQPYGKVATYKLQSLLQDQWVQLQPLKKGRDLYNRILAKVFQAEENIGLSMVKNGYATYYRPKCRDYPQDKKYYELDPIYYVEAESHAKKNRLGLWQFDEITLPCLHRKNKRLQRSSK